jgi:hypothetical protein
LQRVWQLAHSLLGTRIANIRELAKVYEINRAIFFVSEAGSNLERQSAVSSDISGVLAVLYLSHSGEVAVLRGEFTPNSIRPEWLVGTCEPPHAIYAWAIAARGPISRRKMVLLAKRLSHVALGHLEQYSHAVTPAGERMLRMLGFSELQQGGAVQPMAERIFHRAPNR